MLKDIHFSRIHFLVIDDKRFRLYILTHFFFFQGNKGDRQDASLDPGRGPD